MSTGSSGSLSIPGLLPFGGCRWTEEVDREPPAPPPLPSPRRSPAPPMRPVPIPLPVDRGPRSPSDVVAAPTDVGEVGFGGMLAYALRRREFVVTVVSSAVHMILVILLALWHLAPPQRPAIRLTATIDEQPVRPDLMATPQVEVPTVAAGPRILSVTQPATPIVAPINLGRNTTAPKTLASLNERILGDVARTGGAGGLDAVTFFNSTIVAQRVVFIVDASSSMEGSKFARAKEELLTAVSNLQPTQRFFVYFFSDKEYAMFAPRTPTDMVQLDTKHWEQLLRWVNDQGLVADTRPRRALQRAFNLRPDVIFLLTDGDFNDDTYNYLMRSTNKKVRVNTIGFDVGEAARNALQRIAEKFRGEFTEVN
jgi:hypothetical protein